MQKLQQNFHCWRILEKTRKKSCRDLWKEDKKNGPGVEAEEEKKIDKAINDLDEKTKTYTDQLFKLSLEIDELFEESDDCIWGVFEAGVQNFII